MKPNLAILVLLLAAAGPAAAPAQPVPPSRPRPAPTVEPTLSLRLDLELEGIEHGKGRGRGRLRIAIEAIEEIRDVEIRLDADPDLSIPDAAGLPPSVGRLARGEKRAFLLAIEGPDDRDRPVRAEAIFRTADGTLLSLGAGTSLPSARPSPEGRLHLGALEYPALVLPGPRP